MGRAQPSHNLTASFQMSKQNFSAGAVSDALLRVSGNGANLYPNSGTAREMRRAAERRAKKAAKRAAKEAGK